MSLKGAMLHSLTREASSGLESSRKMLMSDADVPQILSLNLKAVACLYHDRAKDPLKMSKHSAYPGVDQALHIPPM
jgi:hypothetical protein